MEQAPDTLSTSQGPWKFETRNCGTAKDTPAVAAAGQTSQADRHPPYAATTQNGISTEKNGSCLPTMRDNSSTSIPVTWLSVVMGIPIDPNATGAVLAISARTEASSGRNPNWMRIAPVMATGAPNPATPSMNAPSENAIRINCTRGSGASPERLRRSTSKSPASTVTW